MKLVLDTKSFVEAVAWVAKALDTKDDKSYIALVVDADGIGHLNHINGLSFIKSSIKVDSIELEKGETEVKLALSAPFLKRFASTLRDHTEPLTFSKDLSDPRTSLVVTRPQENYTLPLLDARIGNQPSYEVIGNISDGEYFDALTKLAKLTDPVNAGVFPVIGTVDLKLDAEEKTITIMATDRYALGEIVLPFNPEGSAEFFKDAKNLLLAEERASLISPSKGKIDSIELIYEAKAQKFGYAFPDGRIVLFALSTAEPLAYGAIKTKSSDTTAEALLSVAELRNAISSISSLAYDETSILLTFSKKGIVVADIKETNSLRVNVEEIKGLEEPLRVRFARAILNEALGPIATNRAKFKWRDGNSAFIFVPVFDDDTAADNVFLLAIPEQE